MRTLRKDKKPLYICKKINDSEPIQFETPVLVHLNTVATTGESDMVAFGEEYRKYRRATVPIEDFNKYHEGDRAYIFVEPPVIHDVLCDGCDFEIKSVLDSQTCVKILFKRLQNG